MTTATFKTSGDLRVLDLADLPDVPSLFDEQQRHLRSGLRFIRGFADELALPIQRNGQEHIDYIPTQMVSEYFRTVYKSEDGVPLDGLCYRSAKYNGGVCVCLFLTHDDFNGGSARVPLLQSVNKFPVP
jgi:hypothetical protein